MTSLLILNGPNLNLLGQRQPEIYGRTTLQDIENQCLALAVELSIDIEFRQSNSEGELIDIIHKSRNTHDGMILNAGAYTHTSVALMDAISSAEIPTIELHLSNIHAREDFRHTSYIARVAVGVICGFGAYGYQMAIKAILNHVDK
ncbi:type II 3-dehydroquinate dehydratase [Roseovarius sp. EL26]|uniref:type II 3-dehydroquinate dehydratase n=1 Tax=Roseovarius sp. EL26 TaxID=2126672 RepID=UPI000EA1E8EA|nr:type II 3-dehydroquinate dehydratase [Roseovarius sp. EL26]